MVDVFEEVEGDLRSERYKQLGLKVLPWVMAGLLVGLVVAGGLWAFTSNRDRAAASASETYASALKLVTAGDLEAAYTEFGKIKPSSKAYRAFALMQQGAIRLEQGNTREAVVRFDQAAEAAPKGELGFLISDAARLKSAFALMDETPYAQIEGRLKPLTEEGRPYRALAREALGLAKINAGKAKEARADFVVLSLMNDAPEGLRDRARATIAMIDSGTLLSMPAVVKAAGELPPMPQLPPGMMIPGLNAPRAAPGGAQ